MREPFNWTRPVYQPLLVKLECLIELTIHIILVHTGIIYWQVIEGKLDEAEQQIEFLTEIQSSIGKNTVS